MDKSIDFDQVADLYDAHVTADFDIDFWKTVAADSPEPRLELMCGTGRITFKLLEAGISCEGLDYSGGLLEEFKKKLLCSEFRTKCYTADARDFHIDRRFALIFIAFHSIAEVLHDDEKINVFRCAARHLGDDGVFWVTAHNPPIRKRTIDGHWHSLGERSLKDGQLKMQVSGRFELDEKSGIVTGTQLYKFESDGERLQDRELSVQFHLITPKRLEQLLVEAGFVIEQTFGDYLRSPFDPDRSPVYIARAVKARK